MSKLTEVEELRAKLAEYERAVSHVYSLLAPAGPQGRTYASDIRKARAVLSSVPAIAVPTSECVEDTDGSRG